MEAPATGRVKVGPITLALGLIALGLGLLAVNLGYTEVTAVLKFWPLLLIGLGMEYFIRKLTVREKEIHFSILSSFLIGLIIISSVVAIYLHGVIPGNLSGLGISWGNASYVRQWQGDPVAVATGSRLELENQLGSVEIISSPDDKLHLSARIEGRGLTEDSARQAAESTVIHVENGPVVRVYTDAAPSARGNGVSIKLQAAVPAGLNISTTNRLGGIEVKGLSAGSLDLENSAGGIDVEEYTGTLKARNNLGEVKLNGVKGNADIEASMGRIIIRNPGGDVTAINRNGVIDLESDNPLDGKYILRGENGAITFKLPRSSDLNIKASSHNGKISGLNTGGSVNKSGETTLGGGKGYADLETENGYIDVSVTG